MRSLDQDLRQINIQIGDEESEGNVPFFEKLLAPTFAMRRANGVLNNRSEFIKNVQPGPRRETIVHEIALLGERRALAHCTVRLLDSSSPGEFSNLRLFIRDSGTDEWLLMAWANERAQ